MTPSQRIDRLIAELTDWRGKTFANVRKSILEADREIIEEWKWMGSPVWSRDGMIAVANAHKGKVKLTFLYGAKLPDPDKLFNAGLEGNARRAIDFFEGNEINERALKISSAPHRLQSEQIEEASACGCSGETTQKQEDKRLRLFSVVALLTRVRRFAGQIAPQPGCKLSDRRPQSSYRDEVP